MELQPEGSRLLAESLRLADIDHITPLCADLRTLPAGSYQTVACNPPYFTGGFVSQKPGRGAARHEGSCTMEDVARRQGVFCRTEAGFACVSGPSVWPT